MNDVIALDRAALRNPSATGPELFRLLHRLRAGKFSLVVDFQGYGETAWLSWWSGAPERWGSVYGAGREWLYTRGITRNERIHHADWHLSLLRQCGLRAGEIQNEFVLPVEALAEARKLFMENNLDPAKSTLFLQPFTSTPFKSWPLENFLALARHFHSRGVQIIFGGGPADRAALEPARTAGFAVSAGAPLLVSAGLVKLSTLTIGGVTGLLHLAVAMQKRVVMLIGPASEPGFPYQHRNWGMTPAVGHNVADIQVSAVIDACSKALNESAGNASC
ncbi:MAG: glycosyltransferase family 9 protein [Verrucomicrobiota bacterium]|nr:glycosyltransferase family 9 protein [Verrucomicrobiota bacterium]